MTTLSPRSRMLLLYAEDARMTSFLVPALITLAVAGLAFRAIRRRTDPPRPPDHSPDTTPAAPILEALIDASRRMRTAQSTVVIRTMTAIDAEHLVDADTAAFVPSIVGRRRIYPPSTRAEIFVRSEVETGRIADVLAGGAPLRDVLEGDPALLAGVRVAVLAHPVRVRGDLVGAIVVARSAEQPFAESDAETIAQLAAISGAALDAAAPRQAPIAPIDVDELTRLHNRRRLDQDLGEVADLEQVAVALIEIDGLARVSASHGHSAGDDLIVAIADVIARRIRSTDVVYRAAGGTFNVLMPGANAEQAAKAMQRVQRAISSEDIRTSDDVPVTVTIGVAAGGGDDSLAARAGTALSEARHQGPNSIVANS